MALKLPKIYSAHLEWIENQSSLISFQPRNTYCWRSRRSHRYRRCRRRRRCCHHHYRQHNHRRQHQLQTPQSLAEYNTKTECGWRWFLCFIGCRSSLLEFLLAPSRCGTPMGMDAAVVVVVDDAVSNWWMLDSRNFSSRFSSSSTHHHQIDAAFACRFTLSGNA